MGYSHLYDFAQTLQVPISRATIRPKVIEFTDIGHIGHVKTGLNTSICRGFYLSAQNTEHRLVQQVGNNIVVTARELDDGWERFVYTKELMHAFDNPDEATDSGDDFDTLLTELVGPPEPSRSPQLVSEFACFWMALGTLCPESVRQDLRRSVEKGTADTYEIALQLKIPERYVLQLIQDRFKAILDPILERG